MGRSFNQTLALLMRTLANEYEQKGFNSGTASRATVAMGSSKAVVVESCGALAATFSARDYRHPAWGYFPVFTGK